ncbi:MAG: flagellar biosynthesis protein FlhB [Gammaproteobacteria bacterium]|jgi:flagellar biosynthesis protein FlhB|nr:flagellar biosynthesis protein FlhB [Gammaproteobacteria bacterium]
MAQQDDGQERTEEATPKRLEDARKKGQIARSRELNTMAMLLLGALGLMGMAPFMIGRMEALFRTGLSLSREAVFDPWAMIDIFSISIMEGIALVMPFMVLMLVTALLAPMALGGWSFSVDAMAPKFEKLNPLKGLKRIFALRGLVELVKALAKFLLIGGVGALLLVHYMPHFNGLAYETVPQALAHAGSILGWSFLILSLSLMVIAAIDVPFQIWDHAKNLKMTRQEIKDEYKTTEGKPEVKAQIRRMQQELAQGRMMSEVPKADVVITNPTHFAVALKYDPKNMRAPLVVAKGADLIASQIRTVATANGVPLFEAPPLARAIYYSTDIDREVPAGLYLAVAQVLAYVYQLRTARRKGGFEPHRPVDLPVPDEFFQGPTTSESDPTP